MSAERIIMVILGILTATVAAPVAFFYLRPRYERFGGEELKEYPFLMVFAGPLALKAETERGWRISLTFIALLDLILGCILLYVALFFR